jgi:hypothetical protein
MKGLLECQISKGMFPSERLVSFQDSKGEQIQLFAPIGLIKDGRLEVKILERAGDLTLVLLSASSANDEIGAVVPTGKVEATVGA